MRITPLKTFLLRGGVLLGGSAVLSKFLGIWRDRLFIDIFGQGETLDAIITAFRIPDFFFFLLISGTVSTILIPRMKGEKNTHQLLSSFLWRIMIGFGSICIMGILFSSSFASFIGKGLSPEAQEQVAYLSRFIFGSVFLLSIAAVLGAYVQKKEQFFFLALSPLIYTLVICVGTYLWGEEYQLPGLGLSIIAGALCYLIINSIGLWRSHGKIVFQWTPPKKIWKGIYHDFGLRVVNNSAFQINQTVDIFIAGFLVAGAVGAFNHGTNLGNILLSIVGLSVANSTFPRLAKTKKTEDQKQIVLNALKWIWFFCIPVSVLGAFFAQELVELVYTFKGTVATLAATVFFWTIISLPATCSIPTLSRFFLARGDTKTPLYITITTLSIATGTAALLVFKILPPESQILGLALGNFIASTLSFTLFMIFIFASPRHSS